MNEKLNNDMQLREKLDNFSVQPPPLIWDNIKGQLAVQRRKKRLVYIGWTSAAAVIVFAFMAGWYFNNNSDVIAPLSVERQRIESEIGQDEKVIKESKVLSANADVKQLPETQNLQITDKNRGNNLNAVFASNTETKNESAAISTIERISLNRLERIDAKVKNNQPEILLAQHKNISNEYKLNEIDKYLVAANTIDIESKKSVEPGWKMGMHISPAYSSYVSSHSDNYLQNMSNSSESANGNVGGGFSVQYKTSKKLRVESGIYYAKSGQKTENSFELLAFTNREDNASFAPNNNYDYLSAVRPTSSNTVSIENGNIAMNSTAGVIEMAATPKGAEIAADFESAKYGFSNTLVSNGEFSQVFDFIEIPLYLRYSIIDSKIGLEIVGGLNAGIIVGNNAYIDNSYGLQKIGETQDISTVNLSGTVGVGVNYDLGKHISVAVEPRLNYYLNSINQSSEVDFRPYRIGFYTGLYYEF
ncbi:MAG: PorT family protein [Bacteroidetes bacterium]|nr:PorT family protein [Bacteroidota bacterium]